MNQEIVKRLQASLKSRFDKLGIPDKQQASVLQHVAEAVGSLEPHLSTKHAVVTAPVAFWHNPDTDPPPLGRKITVMSWGGIQLETVGSTSTKTEFAAWAPLIDKPDWLVERLQRHYQRNMRDHEK
ncbi:MAG: hypothetical protein E6R03_13265 [Hyphomicrobiaceae bacterium]|nr:MAG: hypothetical protein E6R03_13265 [Hyphomicrobiaceae bacterium]